MVLKAQKSLKKTKIHSWRQVRIHGFVAHWNKTSRFFFSIGSRWKFEMLQFRAELRKLPGHLQRDPWGALRGKPTFWSRALLEEPLQQRKWSLQQWLPGLEGRVLEGAKVKAQERGNCGCAAENWRDSWLRRKLFCLLSLNLQWFYYPSCFQMSDFLWFRFSSTLVASY